MEQIQITQSETNHNGVDHKTVQLSVASSPKQEAMQLLTNLTGKCETSTSYQWSGILVDLANKNLTNLTALNEVYRFLDIGPSHVPDLAEKAEKIKNGLSINLIDQVLHSTPKRWSPDRIEELVRLSLSSSTSFKEVAQQMKKGIFYLTGTHERNNLASMVDRSVAIHYNASYAMATTEDPAVREELFSILCLEKDYFSPYSEGAKVFYWGSLSPSNETLVRQRLVISALDLVGAIGIADNPQSGKTGKERSSNRKLRTEAAITPFSLTEILDNQDLRAALRAKNPGRYDQLIEFIRDFGESYYSGVRGNDWQSILKRSRELRTLQVNHWSYQLPGFNEDPLSQVLQQRWLPQYGRIRFQQDKDSFIQAGFEPLTSHGIQITHQLQLSVFGRSLSSVELQQAVVREVFGSLLNQNPTNPERRVETDLTQAFWIFPTSPGYSDFLDTERKIGFGLYKNPEQNLGTLGSLLEQLHPQTDAEKADHEAQLLRDQIKNHFRRAAGDRGYQVIPPDPALRAIGYKSIIFKNHPNGLDTQVSLKINNLTFHLNLNPEMEIKMERDILGWGSEEDRAWLELLVLSQFQRVVCFDPERIDHELVRPEKQKQIYRRQIGGKDQHMRRLPLGECYTPEQARKYEKSGISKRFGEDKPTLLKYNQTEIGLNEDQNLVKGTYRIWTFVSADDLENKTSKTPIRISFKGSTDVLHQVAALGQVSEAERQRIEQEILAEVLND